VTIDEQMIQLDGGVLQVGKPKTAAWVRTVAIPLHLLPEVEAHLAEFVDSDPDAWVFLGPRGAMLRRSNFSVTFRRAQKKAGLSGFTFHDLRHHAATLAAGIPGVTTRDLMARMGHSSARAALLYQHAAADRDVALAASLSDVANAQSPSAKHARERSSDESAVLEHLRLDSPQGVSALAASSAMRSLAIRHAGVKTSV
jgi:integrase